MSILNNLGFEYTVARKSKRKGSKKANPFLLLLQETSTQLYPAQ